jgi:choline dehydrogenase-like flavoprotein
MKNTNKSTYDAIIIGTGPGGATVARELSLNGKRVLMAEAGSMPKIKGTGLQTLPAMRLKPTVDDTAVVWQVATGGATFSYCATALDPPFELFDKYDVDLRGEVEEAKNELPIGPLSDYLIGPMTKRIMEAAQDVGYEWQKLPKFIDQAICRPGCWRCWYNCPYGAKWTARKFVEEALDNGGKIVNKAKVIKVLIEDNKATGIIYNQKGKSHVAFAPLVIVSAGGINTPLLLRASGIAEAGYDFFIDPLIVVVGTVKGLKGGTAEVPMATGMEVEEDGYLMTDITPTASLYLGMAMGSLKFGKIFSGSGALAVMIKIRDSLSGSIPEKGKIDKTMGPKEMKAFNSGYEKAEKILRKAGAKDIFKTQISGAHPGATAKIGEVVDKNLQTKYENLYVCDASVIPEAFGFPPVLTAIALGKRLGKHLTN